jgi:RTX calcium-binding nonapeptide repeat (4 copies)
MSRFVRIVMLVLVVPVALVVGFVVAPIEMSRAAPSFTVGDTVDAPDAHLDGLCASTHLGLCTLRAAIQELEHLGGGLIFLPTTGSGDYRLTIPPGAEATGPPSNATGDLDISTYITVVGDGVAASVIDGNGTHRIFDVHRGGTLTLRTLTVQNGKGDYDGATGHEHGGAIHNHGALTLDRVAVINSSVTAPGWGGGGITNAGTGTATLANVTIAGNSTNAYGGGIENLGTLGTMDVTIADNSSSPWGGGGIFVGINPNTGTPSTTVAGATLVARNTGRDCVGGGGSVTSSGANLDSDSSCGFIHATDRTGDPGFDTSALGPPLFYPLLATSQAVDTTNTLCMTNDILGATRVQPLQDGNGDGVALCDTGSYERATMPSCNGRPATIFVNDNGIIVGGPSDGRSYGGKLSGTAGDDVILGTSGPDAIAARAGKDVICAGDGNDEIYGGDGNDRMTGGLGADHFDGGADKDQATDFSSAQGDKKTAVEL